MTAASENLNSRQAKSKGRVLVIYHAFDTKVYQLRYRGLMHFNIESHLNRISCPISTDYDTKLYNIEVEIVE